MNEDILHDRNEKQRRSAENMAAKIEDVEMRKVILASIQEFYGLIQKRIDKGSCVLQKSHIVEH